jgi:hypothetical protein
MADSFTCPRCGRTSHHPDDVRERYCGACHEFTDDVAFDEAVRVLRILDAADWPAAPVRRGSEGR